MKNPLNFKKEMRQFIKAQDFVSIDTDYLDELDEYAVKIIGNAITEDIISKIIRKIKKDAINGVYFNKFTFNDIIRNIHCVYRINENKERNAHTFLNIAEQECIDETNHYYSDYIVNDELALCVVLYLIFSEIKEYIKLKHESEVLSYCMVSEIIHYNHIKLIDYLETIDNAKDIIEAESLYIQKNHIV